MTTCAVMLLTSEPLEAALSDGDMINRENVPPTCPLASLPGFTQQQPHTS